MSEERWRLGQRISLEYDDTGDTGILCDIYRADICTCNRSAWLLVQLLRNGATATELVSTLHQRFKLGEEDARRDAMALIGHLQSMGYVHAAE